MKPVRKIRSALAEPTMGYCSKSQYRYFMKKVLGWEENLVGQGVEIVKFYLSVDIKTRLIRFNKRMNDPLKFWKLSENDLKAREKWERFSKYKKQMFSRTSSELSPRVVVNSNSKREVETEYEIEFKGVSFKGLSAKQYAVIAGLSERDNV